MGGLLLAGLLYDLTTAEILLQLTHVFYLKQTVRNSPPRFYSLLPARSFSFHVSLFLPGNLLNSNLFSHLFWLLADTRLCNLYVVPMNDFTWKKWESTGKFSFLLWSLAALQYLFLSSAFHLWQCIVLFKFRGNVSYMYVASSAEIVIICTIV